MAENATIFHRHGGKSGLESVKEAKAYDVLIWASEKKDFEENMQDYYDSLLKPKK